MVLVVSTLTVFALVAAGSSWLLVHFWAVRARTVDRIKAGPRRPMRVFPAPGVIWHELVARIGKWTPEPSKGAAAVRQKLLNAGIRSATGPRLFYASRVGAAVIFATLSGVVGLQSSLKRSNIPAVLVSGALAGYMLPPKYLAFRIAMRQRAIQKGLPDALDLMVVCVESGLGLDQTIIQVAKEMEIAHPAITDEFTVMNAELRAGKRRADALHNLAERTGVPDVGKLVAVMVQTDRFGTSIGPALREHADYMRVVTRQRAEEKAAKVAVKLVFPIFFCILPSLFVITTGPVVAQITRDLLPHMRGGS